jgi:hypothetical protein
MSAWQSCVKIGSARAHRKGARLEKVVERPPAEELERDETRPAGDLPEVVDRDDVRVLELPGEARLPEEPLLELVLPVGPDVGSQHLDGDFPVDRGLDGLEHQPVRPPREEGGDGEFPADDLAYQRVAELFLTIG